MVAFHLKKKVIIITTSAKKSAWCSAELPKKCEVIMVFDCMVKLALLRIAMPLFHLEKKNFGVRTLYGGRLHERRSKGTSKSPKECESL